MSLPLETGLWAVCLGSFVGSETLLWALRLSVGSSAVSSFCIAYSWFKSSGHIHCMVDPCSHILPSQHYFPFPVGSMQRPWDMECLPRGYSPSQWYAANQSSVSSQPHQGSARIGAGGAGGACPCCSDSEACSVAKGAAAPLDGSMWSAGLFAKSCG